MSKVTMPFTTAEELYHGLVISTDPYTISRQSKTPEGPLPPRKAPVLKSHLPGHPTILLSDPDMSRHLQAELVSPNLDRFAPYLWLVATQSGTHISSLTEQIVHGRNPVVTHNPELHLVWAYESIYLKPIPKYLLSSAFWSFYLLSESSFIPKAQREEIKASALGFLRSYASLIRHKSDFTIATSAHLQLIPKNIRFYDFMLFMSHIQRSTPDSAVSPRYHYGQLRLTRLNFWCKIFLFQWDFQNMHVHYASYFSSFYAPLLFAFGFFSVALGSMQVVLATQGFTDLGPEWTWFNRYSRGFSVFALMLVSVAVLALIILLVAMVGREFLVAIKDRWRRRAMERRKVNLNDKS